jgi:large repetitive protein
MLRVCHRPGLWMLSGVVAAVLAAAAVLLPVTPASASTNFVQMHYACALKTNGLMSYVSKPSQCTKGESRIKIAPGPVYACLHPNRTVHEVAAASDCTAPEGVRVLTLPPSAAPVYFCAAIGTGVLTFTTHPDQCASKGALVAVVVRVPHRPPSLGGIETSALQYDAGTPAVPVTSSLTVTAPSDTNLTRATVKISSGFVSAEDVLSFASQNGITGSYDSSTGVLTLSGTSSVANYQAALRAVTYNDPDGASPTTGTRTISFQVSDGRRTRHLSNVVSRSVTVNPNSPPVAGNVSASTGKNTAINIDVLASCSDPDGDTVSVTAVNTTGTLGSVSINPDGTIHYDPNGQFQSLTQGQTATDSFGYTVTDGYFDASATVTVTINGVNDPPVISNIESSPLSYQAQAPPVQITSALTLSDDDDTTMSGATVSITSGFDSGADTLSFANTSTITGSYDASTGVLTLTGDDTIANYQAALRSVQFSTSDSSASPAARTVSFAVTDSLGATSTSTAQRVIDVSQAPQPPTAVNQSYTAVGNTPLGVGTSPTGPAVTVSGSLLNGDSDPDPTATLSVTGNTQPANGTVTVNPDGTFTYVPNAGFSGTDSFTYTIAGSNDPSETATATVTITVGPVVWYVDNSSSSAGTGVSTAPFNTLAAANSAAGQNSIVFLYQGSGDYTGGVTMQSGESLWGQPNGLTVDGYSLVAAGGSAPTITNSGGDGIDLAENADVEGVNVANTSGNGIAASGVNDATVGTSTAVAISGAGGDGVDVSGGDGNLDFAGASVTGSTGHSVSVGGRTGGTVTFGGDIADTSTGITLSGNSGAAINFSGTLTLSTGTSTAFSAAGGGTVTATGGGTVTTSTATAVSVMNTTIGSGGLTFQSVSADGASPGILLSSTGSSGGLTVTGTGSAGSGGTIQGSAGEGIMLSSTSSPSFTDMVIKNNAADGINGSGVSGLTLAGSTVSGNGTATSLSGQNDPTPDNDGLDFLGGLTGTVTISNSTVTNSADNGLQITDSSGSLNLTITGSTFSGGGSGLTNNDDPLLGDGVEVFASGPANATVSVTGSTFTNNQGYHFDFEPSNSPTGTGSGTNSITFNNNTLSNSTGLGNGGGVNIQASGSSTTSFDVNSNNIQGAQRNAIALFNDGTTQLSGTVDGNTVGSPSVSCSGSVGGDDVAATTQGSATTTLAITNNKLYQYDNPAGIGTINGEGSGTMNLTITGNTIADPVPDTVTCPTVGGPVGALWGLWLNSGTETGDTSVTCADITNNSMTGSAPSVADGGITDFELDEISNSTSAGIYDLPGYTGGGEDSNAAVSFIQQNNTPSGGSAPSGGTFINDGSGPAQNIFFGASSCPLPS